MRRERGFKVRDGGQLARLRTEPQNEFLSLVFCEIEDLEKESFERGVPPHDDSSGFLLM